MITLMIVVSMVVLVLLSILLLCLRSSNNHWKRMFDACEKDADYWRTRARANEKEDEMSTGRTYLKKKKDKLFKKAELLDADFIENGDIVFKGPKVKGSDYPQRAIQIREDGKIYLTCLNPSCDNVVVSGKIIDSDVLDWAVGVLDRIDAEAAAKKKKKKGK